MRKVRIERNFTKVPNKLMDELPLSPVERLIVIFVLRYNECFVGQRVMAKKLSMSRSTVSRAIIRLLKMNVLTKSRRGSESWSVTYSVNPPSKWQLEDKGKRDETK